MYSLVDSSGGVVGKVNLATGEIRMGFNGETPTSTQLTRAAHKLRSIEVVMNVEDDSYTPLERLKDIGRILAQLPAK